MSQKIKIISPAKAIEKEAIDSAKKYLESHGFIVEVGSLAFNRFNYFSGTDEERAKEFQDAINDHTIDIILCARGGYGSIRIVDRIDFTPLIKNPKTLIGFSDITVFHHHINRYIHIPTVHGTTPLNFQTNTEESLTSLLNVMNGKGNNYNIPICEDNKIGQAKAELIGGNLSMIYALNGTNSDINFDGKILFFEDLAENIYSVDRMLWSLDKSGKFENLKGLIVGGMTNISDTTVPFGKTVKELILDILSKYNFPICFNFPAGHIEDNRALIFGKETELIITENSVEINN